MPVTYKIIRDKKLVYTKLSGPVSQRDLFEHIDQMARLFAEKTLDTSWRQLIAIEDMAYIGSAPRETVHELAARNPWPAACKRVIVSPQKFYRGMAEIYLNLVDPDRRHTQLTLEIQMGRDFLNQTQTLD